MEQKLEKVLAIVERLEKKFDTCTQEIKQLNVKVHVLENQNKQLTECVTKLDEKLDYMENQSRRNNLVIYGLEEKNGEDWKITEELTKTFIETYFGMKIGSMDIERAHRLGYSNSGKRPIIAKFCNFKIKNDLIKNGKKLKGTNYAISEDFSQKVKTQRNEMKPFLEIAKAEGKHAYLSFNKLVVDGKKLNYEEVVNSKGSKPNREDQNKTGNLLTAEENIPVEQINLGDNLKDNSERSLRPRFGLKSTKA